MKAESEQEARALQEFERLISRPVPCFRWYKCAMKEPAVYRWWRLHASVVHRIELWLACGLPKWPGMQKMLREFRSRERKTYSEWLKLKHKISADYLAGRCTRPPWGCSR